MLIKTKIPLVFGMPQDAFFDRLKAKKIFVAELRPGLEGTKIVAVKALKKGFEPVIICDSMLAFCMERGLVSKVHIFYNSIKKEQSASCRTGSLIAALCAQRHGIDVELSVGVVGPLKTSSLLKIDTRQVTAPGIKTYVPLTEEVPLGLITKIK